MPDKTEERQPEKVETKHSTEVLESINRLVAQMTEVAKTVTDAEQRQKAANELTAKLVEQQDKLQAVVPEEKAENRVMKRSVADVLFKKSYTVDDKPRETLAVRPPKASKMIDEWDDEPSDPVEHLRLLAFQAKFADQYLRACAQHRGRDYGGFRTLKSHKRLMDFVEKASGSFLDTGTTAGGVEWVPELYSNSTFIDYYELVPNLMAMFRQNMVRIPQGTGSFSVPADLSQATATIVDEVTAISGNSDLISTIPAAPISGRVSFSPVKHKNGVPFSWEMTEDSVIDQYPYARRAIERGMSQSIEEAILNGQPENDTGLDGTNSHAAANKYGNGLRFFAHHDPGTTPVDAGGAALTSVILHAQKKAAGKFGIMPEEWVYVLSPASYMDLVNDGSSNLQTREKYGDAATIVTGEVAKVWGSPVVVSPRMSQIMNAGGDLNSTTSNLTGAIGVNRTRWYPAIKRDLEIRIVPNPAFDYVAMYGFVRSKFEPAPGTGADAAHTQYTYNLTT